MIANTESLRRRTQVMNLSIAQTYVYLPWQSGATLPQQTLQYVPLHLVLLGFLALFLSRSPPESLPSDSGG